jgi:hypothetical protein
MKKIIALITLLSFVYSSTLAAQTTHSAFAIKVPEENGKVTQRYKGKSTQTVIHIQDAHSSFEAQENLSAIITYLSKAKTSESQATHDILIGIEGASGPVELSAFREYPLADVRQRIGKDFVKKGVFTGSELAAIAAEDDNQISLYGVEDTQLFTENFRAFYGIATKQSELEIELEALEESLNLLKEATFSPQLTDFDQSATAFEHDPSQLMRFLGALYQNMATLGIEEMDYFTLLQFKEVFILQASIKNDLLQKELSNLAETVSASFPAENDEITQRYEAYKNGKISEQAMGTYLYARTMSYGIVQNKYPMLTRSIQYWRKFAVVDMAQLLPDIMNASHAIRLKLAHSDAERNVVEAQHTLMRLRQLIRLESLKSDVENFRHNRDRFSLESIAHKLRQAKLQSGAQVKIPAVRSDLDQILDRIDTFYERAEERDKAMLTNLLTQMAAEGADTGVLVAGGYHSAGLVELMRAQEISFLTVMPAITTTVQDVAYMDRMMGNIAPLTQSLISHFNYSRLNALLSAIASDQELSAVLKDFTEALELETARDIDLSARLFNATRSDERYGAIAKALWEVATQLATDTGSIQPDQTIDMQLIRDTISRGNYMSDLLKQIRALHDPGTQRFSARDDIRSDPRPALARQLQEALADLSPFIISLVKNNLLSAISDARSARFIDEQIGIVGDEPDYARRINALEKALAILDDPATATLSPEGIPALWDSLESLDLAQRPLPLEDILQGEDRSEAQKAEDQRPGTQGWTETANIDTNAYQAIRARIATTDQDTEMPEDASGIPIRFEISQSTLEEAAKRTYDGISPDELKGRIRSIISTLIDKARQDSWGLVGDFTDEAGSIVISENAEMYMHQNSGTIYIPFGTLRADNTYSGITGALEYEEFYVEAAVKIFHELWHESSQVNSVLEEIITQHLRQYVESDGTVSEANREYIEEVWLTYRNRVELFRNKIGVSLVDAEGLSRYSSLTVTQTELDRIIENQNMKELRQVARQMAIEDVAKMSVTARISLPFTDANERSLVNACVAMDNYAQGLSLVRSWEKETLNTFEENAVDMPAMWRTLDFWNTLENPGSINILISRGIEENEPVRLALEAMFKNEEFKKRNMDLHIVYEAQDGIERDTVKTSEYALILQMEDEDFGLDNTEATPTAFAFSRAHLGNELTAFHSALLLLLAHYIEALRSGLGNINENMYSNIFEFNNGVFTFSEDFVEKISTQVVEAVKQHVFNIAA